MQAIYHYLYFVQSAVFHIASFLKALKEPVMVHSNGLNFRAGHNGIFEKSYI